MFAKSFLPQFRCRKSKRDVEKTTCLQLDSHFKKMGMGIKIKLMDLKM